VIEYGNLNVSPLGVLWIAISSSGLNAVKIGGDGPAFARLLVDDAAGAAYPKFDNEIVSPIAAQLQEYFDGQRRRFEVEIDWGQLTTFQEAALRVTFEIPFGEVRTYGQVATEMGRSPATARAVGRAMATNPIPIIIPCHRVVGANGELTGYGGPGGIKTKAWLLEFEGHHVARQMRLPW
jgi:methylated-DNA-[protein]-cysteine S-methyltransferase